MTSRQERKQPNIGLSLEAEQAQTHKLVGAVKLISANNIYTLYVVLTPDFPNKLLLTSDTSLVDPDTLRLFKNAQTSNKFLTIKTDEAIGSIHDAESYLLSYRLDSVSRYGSTQLALDLSESGEMNQVSDSILYDFYGLVELLADENNYSFMSTIGGSGGIYALPLQLDNELRLVFLLNSRNNTIHIEDSGANLRAQVSNIAKLSLGIIIENFSKFGHDTRISSIDDQSRTGRFAGLIKSTMSRLNPERSWNMMHEGDQVDEIFNIFIADIVESDPATYSSLLMRRLSNLMKKIESDSKADPRKLAKEIIGALPSRGSKQESLTVVEVAQQQPQSHNLFKGTLSDIASSGARPSHDRDNSDVVETVTRKQRESRAQKNRRGEYVFTYDEIVDKLSEISKKIYSGMNPLTMEDAELMMSVLAGRAKFLGLKGAILTNNQISISPNSAFNSLFRKKYSMESHAVYSPHAYCDNLVVFYIEKLCNELDSLSSHPALVIKKLANLYDFITPFYKTGFSPLPYSVAKIIINNGFNRIFNTLIDMFLYNPAIFKWSQYYEINESSYVGVTPEVQREYEELFSKIIGERVVGNIPYKDVLKIGDFRMFQPYYDTRKDVMSVSYDVPKVDEVAKLVVRLIAILRLYKQREIYQEKEKELLDGHFINPSSLKSVSQLIKAMDENIKVEIENFAKIWKELFGHRVIAQDLDGNKPVYIDSFGKYIQKMRFQLGGSDVFDRDFYKLLYDLVNVLEKENENFSEKIIQENRNVALRSYVANLMEELVSMISSKEVDNKRFIEHVVVLLVKKFWELTGSLGPENEGGSLLSIPNEKPFDKQKIKWDELHDSLFAKSKLKPFEDSRDVVGKPENERSLYEDIIIILCNALQILYRKAVLSNNLGTFYDEKIFSMVSILSGDYKIKAQSDGREYIDLSEVDSSILDKIYELIYRLFRTPISELSHGRLMILSDGGQEGATGLDSLTNNKISLPLSSSAEQLSSASAMMRVRGSSSAGKLEWMNRGNLTKPTLPLFDNSLIVVSSYRYIEFFYQYVSFAYTLTENYQHFSSDKEGMDKLCHLWLGLFGVDDFEDYLELDPHNDISKNIVSRAQLLEILSKWRSSIQEEFKRIQLKNTDRNKYERLQKKVNGQDVSDFPPDDEPIDELKIFKFTKLFIEKLEQMIS